MALVKRTQIYLDEELDAELRAVASFEGRSAASVIREAVRGYLDQRAQDRGAIEDPFADIIGAFESVPLLGAKDEDRVIYELGDP
jgi:metal-responsive CopG/Arc/MetJ family transcriptional regulator